MASDPLSYNELQISSWAMVRLPAQSTRAQLWVIESPGLPGLIAYSVYRCGVHLRLIVFGKEQCAFQRAKVCLTLILFQRFGFDVSPV